MSDIKNIFDISGRAMASQLVRLNTVASNLANAGTVSGTKEAAFRSLKPVFATKFADAFDKTGVSTVDVIAIESVNRDPVRAHMPNHPSADADGYVPPALSNWAMAMAETEAKAKAGDGAGFDSPF